MLNYRTVLWNRQLDGALNRVPADFYDRVWDVLSRTPAGIKVASYHLPQVRNYIHIYRYISNYGYYMENLIKK